jgi:hypothetical protein
VVDRSPEVGIVDDMRSSRRRRRSRNAPTPPRPPPIEGPSSRSAARRRPSCGGTRGLRPPASPRTGRKRPGSHGRGWRRRRSSALARARLSDRAGPGGWSSSPRSRATTAPLNWAKRSAVSCWREVKLRVPSSLPCSPTSPSNAVQGTSFRRSWKTLFLCRTALIVSCPGESPNSGLE